jgi:hypothetical protein
MPGPWVVGQFACGAANLGRSHLFRRPEPAESRLRAELPAHKRPCVQGPKSPCAPTQAASRVERPDALHTSRRAFQAQPAQVLRNAFATSLLASRGCAEWSATLGRHAARIGQANFVVQAVKTVALRGGEGFHAFVFVERGQLDFLEERIFALPGELFPCGFQLAFAYEFGRPDL